MKNACCLLRKQRKRRRSSGRRELKNILLFIKTKPMHVPFSSDTKVNGILNENMKPKTGEKISLAHSASAHSFLAWNFKLKCAHSTPYGRAPFHSNQLNMLLLVSLLAPSRELKLNQLHYSEIFSISGNFVYQYLSAMRQIREWKSGSEKEKLFHNILLSLPY